MVRARRYVVPYSRIGVSLGLPGNSDPAPVTRFWDEIVQVIRFLIYPTPVVEPWYLEQYPDIAQSLSRNRDFESPTHHFLTAGYFEGRLPSPSGPEAPLPASFTRLKSHFTAVPTRSALKVSFNRADLASMIRAAVTCVPVDEAFYLAAYKDVAAAIELGRYRSAREHYVKSGYLENRIPYEFDLDADWYVNVYKDIAAAAAANPSFDARQHFHFKGYKEGRWPRRDALLWLIET
jgi:hypothetical protein